ncbi:ADP-ribosylglycohydrolase family protein [Oscillatoria laete-virens NRMC-F 0139]|nr:ADP-ribosylglycohydrolase family protein [Oscillatoria laete-virens]MDL5052957.1 ADP-ribosylglycohydrolase family protein [Oscillatoria laete-virens NRMC-F 0139]
MHKRLTIKKSLADENVVWMSAQPCMYGGDLHVEYRQAREEGRDLSGGLERAVKKQIAFRLYPGSGKFDSYQPMDGKWWGKTFDLLDEIQARPIRKDYPYHEPHDLAGIVKARPVQKKAPAPWKGGRSLYEKLVYGAFMGRLVGSQLGAPLEGWYRDNIRIYCEETDGYPMTDYLRQPTKSELARIKKRGGTQWFEPRPPHSQLRGNITYSTENDDIHFTMVNWKILDTYGASFTPMDVGRFWASFFGDGCSAEGVALRNLEAGIAPPHSASFRNPYREWIGAQIRGDYFGYANPGNPVRAAEWAWRDGVVTHVRNGVYGEMWIAALIAEAFAEKNPARVIRAGLEQIPRQCRLSVALNQLLADFASGMDYESFLNKLHHRYDQHDYQDWCHVISNAEICAAALLWGGGDFDRTLAYSVLPGFDTDCNAATVGSVVGLWHADRIPSKWTRCFQDRFKMGFGQGFFSMESIEKTAQAMADAAWRNLTRRPMKKSAVEKIHLV